MPVLIVLAFAQIAEGLVTTNPSVISIPRGLQTARPIGYNVTGVIDCTQANSTGGVFVSGPNVLGSVNTFVSIPLSGGAGITTETVVIPIRVMKAAESLRVNSFQFRRTFSYTCLVPPPPPETGIVQIALTGEASAEFEITRLQLYFENRRAEITVKRNQPALKAFVDIRYVGSGLLQGFWEVDGRILQNVSRHLVYGRSVTIESPEIPSLPPITAGTHVVRFVITSPAPAIPLPEAIYFVTAEEFREKLAIRLTHPENRSEVNYSPLTFQWEGRGREVTYLLEFLEEGGEKPIFSAYSKRLDYSLPAPVLNSLFSRGKTYLWRVKAFDAENNNTGESPLFRFTFK
jgi:hypothetical protein